MALQIIDPSDDGVNEIRSAIEAAVPEAGVEVSAAAPGHFEVSVVSSAFAGKSLVKQQQMVYAAIAPLMSGERPRVHAIDHLRTRVP